MREQELRTVLLVKAIEDTDPDGRVIPPADRIAAARDASRNAGEPPPQAPARGEALSPHAQRLLVARADTLLEQVRVRHPFVQGVHALAGGVPAAGMLLLAAGLLLGGALSALDGTRRVNILAFPLFGLVAWNVAVYVLLLARRIGRRRSPAAARGWLPRLLVRSTSGLVTRVAARSRAFDALLARALGRFAAEWQEAARALLVARATRTFHLAAAAVGVGLIAGLYLRGVALEYQASWDSTFLNAAQAQQLARWIYAPASWITGIAVPDAAQFEALRGASGGGERAARWIHLLAATALVFVVVPRLLLAAAAGFTAMRLAHRAPLPPTLAAHFRSAFAAVSGVIDRGVVMVAPYAYEPGAESLERLRAWLPQVVGAPLPVDLRAPVPFGGEDEFLEGFADRGAGVADVVVALFSMASTPEDENHGAFLAGARDWLAKHRPQSQLVVVVDEAPYASRMGGESGLAARVDERREAWRAFVTARGLEPRFLQLAP